MNSPSLCRSCNRHIRWAKTDAGKTIPIDIQEVEGGNIRLIQVRPGRYMAKIVTPQEGVPAYVSHFATCPNADKHRRKR